MNTVEAVNGSSNVAEPFCDSNPVDKMHRLSGVVKYAMMEGLNRELTTMPAAQRRQTTH